MAVFMEKRTTKDNKNSRLPDRQRRDGGHPPGHEGQGPGSEWRTFQQYPDH